MPTEDECRDHWYGPPYTRRFSYKKMWRYNYRDMARLRRAQRRN